MSSSIIEEDGTVIPNFQFDEKRAANNEVVSLEAEITALAERIDILENKLQNVIIHDGTTAGISDNDKYQEICPLGNRLSVMKKYVKGFNSRLDRIILKVDV